MKFNYLFLNRHRSGVKTYHPFSSNTALTQEKVTKLLMTIPAQERIGTGIYQLFDLMDKNSMEFTEAICPCCHGHMTNVDNPNLELLEKVTGSAWIILEGIYEDY